MRLFACLALAAASAVAVAGPAAAASMVVPIDQQIRLNVPGASYSVLVGNPAVADVTVVDSHTLYVAGRGYGVTDVSVLDRDGRVLYAGDVVVTSPDAGRVSVYRGSARSDMACAPACQVTTRSTGGGGGGATAVASPAAGGLAGVGQAIASATGGPPMH